MVVDVFEETFAAAKRDVLESTQERERMILAAREVTAFSKKFIFGLHRIPVTKEIDVHLRKTLMEHWVNMASSLIVIDENFRSARQAHLYRGTVSNALEELIEAVSFGYYLLQDDFITYETLVEIIKWMLLSRKGQYSGNATSAKRRREKSLSSASYVKIDKDILNHAFFCMTGIKLYIDQEDVKIDSELVQLHQALDIPYLTRMDQLMGLMDLTGEMMRYAIKNLTSGTSVSARSVKISQDLKEFNVLVQMAREKNRKVFSHKFQAKLDTLSSSVSKVEKSIYGVFVREGETVNSDI